MTTREPLLVSRLLGLHAALATKEEVSIAAAIADAPHYRPTECPSKSDCEGALGLHQDYRVRPRLSCLIGNWMRYRTLAEEEPATWPRIVSCGVG